MSLLWMSHVAHMNAARQDKCDDIMWKETYKRDYILQKRPYGNSIMSHIWMQHGTFIDESCHVCGWVMSRLLMSYVTFMNEWMSHVNNSRHTNEGITHFYHRSLLQVTGTTEIIHKIYAVQMKRTVPTTYTTYITLHYTSTTRSYTQYICHSDEIHCTHNMHHTHCTTLHHYNNYIHSTHSIALHPLTTSITIPSIHYFFGSGLHALHPCSAMEWVDSTCIHIHICICVYMYTYVYTYVHALHHAACFTWM